MPDLNQAGGHHLVSTNQLMSSATHNRAGLMMLQTVFGMLFARLGHEDQGDEPFDAFLGDNDCQVVAFSGMTVKIKAGLGFQKVATSDGNYGATYAPIVNEEDVEQIISTADGSNPRIDVIAIKASFTDSESATRTFYPGSSSSTNTIRGLDSTISYTAGTPGATPSAPATPSGYVKIAEVYVAAGAVSISASNITDWRPLWQLHNCAIAEPPAEYATKFVPGSSTELQASFPSTARTVQLVAGTAVIQGRRYRYPTLTSGTFSAGDATHPRRDVVYVNDEGNIGIVAGTAATPAVRPSVSASQCAIAEILIPALATLSSACTLTDLRARAPIGSAQMQDDAIATDALQDAAVTTVKVANDAVTAAKIADGPRVVAAKIICATSHSASGNAVDVQMVDGDGNDIAEQIACKVEIFKDDMTQDTAYGQFGTPGTGTLMSGGSAPYYTAIIKSDSTGLIEFTTVNNAPGTYTHLIVTPMYKNGDTHIHCTPGYEEVYREP